MKVKKIQWGNLYIWNGCERVFKELPFNMAASVRGIYSASCVWSIKQGTKIIASGKAETMNEGKEACETAWKNIVREALE